MKGGIEEVIARVTGRTWKEKERCPGSNIPWLDQCREYHIQYTLYLIPDISKFDKLKSKQFPIQYQLSLNLNFCMTKCSPCMSRNHDGTGLLSTILLSRQLLGGRLVVQWTTRGWNKTRGSTGSLAVRVPASPDHQNLMNINFHIPPKSIYFPHLQRNIVFEVRVVWHHRRSNSRRVMVRFHPS